MINMGDDAEIANMRCVHCLKSERNKITGKRVKKRKFAGKNHCQRFAIRLILQRISGTSL